jgi:hypothetical protein
LLGTGNSYTTGTSGNYYAVATNSSGCTATSRTATATLSGTGGALDQVPTACGCAAGLAVSPCGVCTPIIPAGTLTLSACTLQVNIQDYASTATCPSGWRVPTVNDMVCITNNNPTGAYIRENTGYYTSDMHTCGYDCNKNCNLQNTPAVRKYFYKHVGNSCACGSTLSGNHTTAPYTCLNSCWPKKCVRTYP